MYTTLDLIMAITSNNKAKVCEIIQNSTNRAQLLNAESRLIQPPIVYAIFSREAGAGVLLSLMRCEELDYKIQSDSDNIFSRFASQWALDGYLVHTAKVQLIVSKACALGSAEFLFKGVNNWYNSPNISAYARENAAMILKTLCVFGEKFPEHGDYDSQMRQDFIEYTKLFQSNSPVEQNYIQEFIAEEQAIISAMKDVKDYKGNAEARLQTLRNISQISDDRSVAHKALIIEMLLERPANIMGNDWNLELCFQNKRISYQMIIEILSKDDDWGCVFFATGSYLRATTITEELATGGLEDILAEICKKTDCNKIIDMNTPLIWSIANAANKSAMTIIKEGRNLDFSIIDKVKGNTAPHLAIAKGYTDKNGDGCPLSISNFDLVREMVTRDNVNMLDGEGNSLLHIACARRALDIINFLIELGADTSIKNHAGMTAKNMLDLNAVEAEKFIKNRTTVGDDFQKCYVFDKNAYTAFDLEKATLLLTPAQDSIELLTTDVQNHHIGEAMMDLAGVNGLDSNEEAEVQ